MSAIKKVLIPTDFTVKSLNVLLELLKQDSSSRYEVVLAHGYDIPNSIPELLFYSEHKIISKLQSEEFRESCKLIENSYQSRLISIRFGILTGNNKRYVRNYLAANDITLLALSKEYKMKFKSKNSFDLKSYLKTSKIEMMFMNHAQKTVSELEDTEQLADVFLSNIGNE